MKALLKLCLALVLVGCVLAQSVREDDSLSSSRSSRKKEKDEELSPIGSWRAQVKGYAMVEENKIAELEGTLARLIVPAMPADQVEMGKSKYKAKDEGKIAAVLYSAELSVSPQADSDMAPRTSNIAKKAGNKLRIFAVHRPDTLDFFVNRFKSATDLGSCQYGSTVSKDKTLGDFVEDTESKTTCDGTIYKLSSRLEVEGESIPHVESYCLDNKRNPLWMEAAVNFEDTPLTLHFDIVSDVERIEFSERNLAAFSLPAACTVNPQYLSLQDLIGASERVSKQEVQSKENVAYEKKGRLNQNIPKSLNKKKEDLISQKNATSSKAKSKARPEREVTPTQGRHGGGMGRGGFGGGMGGLGGMRHGGYGGTGGFGRHGGYGMGGFGRHGGYGGWGRYGGYGGWSHGGWGRHGGWGGWGFPGYGFGFPGYGSFYGGWGYPGYGVGYGLAYPGLAWGYGYPLLGWGLPIGYGLLGGWGLPLAFGSGVSYGYGYAI